MIPGKEKRQDKTVDEVDGEGWRYEDRHNKWKYGCWEDGNVAIDGRKRVYFDGLEVVYLERLLQIFELFHVDIIMVEFEFKKFLWFVIRIILM